MKSLKKIFDQKIKIKKQKAEEGAIGIIEQILAEEPEKLQKDMTWHPLFLSSLFEYFKYGFQSQENDLLACGSRPWKFPVSKINSSVEIWIGEKDKLVSRGMGNLICLLAPNCWEKKIHFIPGEGHFSSFCYHFIDLLF